MKRLFAHNLLCLSFIGLCVFSCSQDEDSPFGPSPVPLEREDMGSASSIDQGPIQADQGPLLGTTICAPGQRRCLGELSPLSEVCASDGSRWTPQTCKDQFVCQDQQCVPFTCAPGRAVCLGTDTQAVCADDGQSVRDVERCQGTLTCQSGQCTDLCEDAAQRGSYTGCDYIANQLYNLSMQDASGLPQSPFAIIAANPHPLISTTITLTDPRGVSVPRIAPRTLVPASTYTFGKDTRVYSEILRPSGEHEPIPREATQITLAPGEAAALLLESNQSGPYNLASTQPIVAYQFNPYCCNFTASNDASLLLPTSSLGLSYRIVNYPTMYLQEAGTLTPYISIVASQDNTIVEVDATVPLEQTVLLTGDKSELNEPGAKTAHRIVLERGQAQVLHIPRGLGSYQMGTSDLSGTLVSSNKPVAVFSGHPCTFVPQDAWACDHLEEQMFPADTLGQRYILPALAPRNLSPNRPLSLRDGVYWRLVAHEDAIITTDPPLTELITFESSSFGTPNCLELVEQEEIKLPAGKVCELGLDATLSLESDAPLIIAGVISGHQSTGLDDYGTQAGDPAMFLLPPVRQFRRDYSFVTSPTFKKTYAVISAPRGTWFTYQSSALSEELVRHPTETIFAGQPWDVFSIRIPSGLHTLKADAPFGLVVYAFDDYVSYAFPGGLNLSRNAKGS